MTPAWPISFLLCWLAAGFLSGEAGAHVTATGLAIIEVNDREIGYRLTVVPSELPEATSQLLSRAMAGSRPAAEQVAEETKWAVVVRVDGTPCRPGRIAMQDIGAGKALLDYALHCSAAPRRLELREDWTHLFGEHYQTIATIRSPQGGGEHLLGEGAASVSVDLGTPSPTGLAEFVRLGVEHILTGYDHLLFLFALLVGASSFWQVLRIASMFTLAHSITLSLAVLGLVHAPAAVVEPLIAASIIWVAAVENMLGRVRLWRRCVVTFIFGLVARSRVRRCAQPAGARRLAIGARSGRLQPRSGTRPGDRDHPGAAGDARDRPAGGGGAGLSLRLARGCHGGCLLAGRAHRL